MVHIDKAKNTWHKKTAITKEFCKLKVNEATNMFIKL